MAAALTMATPTSPNRRHNLSIDLSTIPPLVQPVPPSNTLLITNLQAPEIFTASILDNIQRSINEHAAIHTFSPLKSMSRIICTFYTVDDAVNIRKILDGESVLGHRVRVFFGQNTKVEVKDQHLQAPKSQKLFFISPPPSPPMGWEMRNEEPPNKEVHAEDLAEALSKLHARPAADDALRVTADEPVTHTTNGAPRIVTRQRSGTGTVVYDPEEQGHSPDLPAIAVEDTSASPADLSPMEGVETKFVHTARPPIELMEH
ncbi:calcipressin-like protein [Acrodontium crateriforme]|uniref:Calcipressin-like protein n=1 Tax=Acrodontium crateriforme TaxID=150365 RepID=A0AAQ3R9P3_9PEZI|nr:calcipressin-like protein [Acrodontium crateriforme]